MQESNKVESAVQVKNEVKQDEFRVGDVVWCLLNGEGQVISTENDRWSDFNIEVQFKQLEKGETWFYTEDGKLNERQNRTLFFSEPKIEASVTRPFVPTLVGKRVVVQYYDGTWIPHPVVVTAETEEKIFTKNGSDYKFDIVEIYEVSSENLLTSKK